MPVVLVVDDDVDHRDLLRMVLERHAYRVLTTADTDGARRLIARGTVDAVLLDVRLPGESGIALCAALRGDPATRTLPVMLVSADAGDERITTGLAAGADDYLVKPFARTELIVRLDSMVARYGRLAAGRAARLAALATSALLGEPAHPAAARVA